MWLQWRGSSPHSELRFEIYVSKNEKCSDQEGKALDPYLAEITRIIASSAFNYDKQFQLLNLVLKTCVEKIRKKIQKIQKSLFKSSQILQFVSDSRIMAPCNFRWDQLDDGQVVNQQLDLIRQVDLNANSLKSNIPHLANLSRSAFLMGKLTYSFYVWIC